MSSEKCKSKNHTRPLASHGSDLALSGKKEKKGFRCLWICGQLCIAVLEKTHGNGACV
jgi:hypothetical protein